MLDLVRELAEQRGIGHALHTGKLSQHRRREEIRYFKEQADCRLLLSSDSGAVGLNLQTADVVVNLDLPWNPARLEQRIARAWRKHQQRSVQVINLVSENSIEQRMLALLEQKRGMAAGVVDGEGESAMRLPSGRAAFLERLDTLMSGDTRQEVPAPVDPVEKLGECIAGQWAHQVELAQLHSEGEEATLLVVVDGPQETLHEALSGQLRNVFHDSAPGIRLLDRQTHAAIEQLIEAGILQRSAKAPRTVYSAEAGEDARRTRRLAEARQRLAESERKQHMAQLLGEGGFLLEALSPLHEAVEASLRALAHGRGRRLKRRFPCR